MFSQILKQRQNIIASPATMLVCEDNLVSFSWTPEYNNIGQRGYDTQRVLGDRGI